MTVCEEGEDVQKTEQGHSRAPSHARVSPTLVEIFLPSGTPTCAVHRYLLEMETMSECESVLLHTMRMVQ